ncbi:AAA family ATPase [Algoriphagus sp.]|uniref:AAA family ATPase n=1 Tax=Algoriphagus sp. TaxID=1872435 RepID=UPI00391B5A27
MKAPFNPFVINSYQGKAYFCDREEELKDLFDHIKNDRNIVLYAWRRLGKSALTLRLFEELEESNQFETIYIDFLATQNLEEAIKAIASAVYDKYGKTASGIGSTLQKLLASLGATLNFNPFTGLPEISVSVRQPEKASESLRSLGDFLKTRKKRIVLAIDEFQQIGEFENQQAEAVFRTWVQQIPEVRFIFSGSHRSMMEAMFTETKRPFYQSAQLEYLSPIDLKVYSAFIQNHFSHAKKEISEELIQKIYTWGRGQTYTIQLICNQLFANYTKVKEEDIQTVFSQILDQQKGIFANFQKILTRTQWTVFKAIAKEEPLNNPFSKDFIGKHDLGAASSIRTALKALEKQELVIYDEGAYFVHDVQLARWLASL